MGELVTLHTQRLVEPAASTYLGLLSGAIRAGRLNNGFPDRRRLEGTLRALGAPVHQGLYDGIFVDSRSGLPNMASLTRVLTDKSVGIEALDRLEDQSTLDARSSEAEVFQRMAKRRRYYEALSGMHLAPVDEHRVLLRRHEPGESRASFRVELTKIAGTGEYLHVVIELTQTSGLWSHRLIGLDPNGEVAEGTQALRSLVYRFATLDAETLFIRLHELEGVAVERVQRGIVGPALFCIPTPERLLIVAEPPVNPLTSAWADWLESSPELRTPMMAISFATDIAATDVRDERSNDPLSSLFSSDLREQEHARYSILRQRHPFRVYKDRKFVVSPELVPFVSDMCTEAGTKNIVYPLRAR
jgi:hypothetical protein